MNVLNRQVLLFILSHAITGGSAVYFDVVQWVLLAIVTLWLMFIPTGLLLTRHQEKPFTGFRLLLAKVWGIGVFVPANVFVNYTAMTYLFLEFPHPDRKMVTLRLKYYIHYETDTWRGKLAIKICKYLIEPWHWGHCALQKLVKSNHHE